MCPAAFPTSTNAISILTPCQLLPISHRVYLLLVLYYQRCWKSCRCWKQGIRLTMGNASFRRPMQLPCSRSYRLLHANGGQHQEFDADPPPRPPGRESGGGSGRGGAAWWRRSSVRRQCRGKGRRRRPWGDAHLREEVRHGHHSGLLLAE
jgi:hypothetical protein